MEQEEKQIQRTTRLTLGWTLLLALFVTVGCASVKPVPESSPVESLDLDPMLIQAGEKETLDSEGLFQEAQRAFKRRHYEVAAEKYALIIEHFADSKYHLPARYNAALSLERLERWDEAIVHYKAVYDDAPGKPSATDALYRIAECNANLKAWKAVVDTVEEILGRTSLSNYDRIEAKVRLADALFALEDFHKAEAVYREALQLNARATPDEVVPSDAHFVVAAQFGISRIYHELFRSMKLTLPVKKMETDLEDKAQLFTQAQSAYFRTMRKGNPYWATAAGFHIGRMYEDFYLDILSAEYPKDLTAEETEVYFEELRKKIKPLMERALYIYEKNIKLSERTNTDNKFTKQTTESLERLKRYLEDDSLQAMDATKIQRGQSFESLGVTPPPQDREESRSVD